MRIFVTAHPLIGVVRMGVVLIDQVPFKHDLSKPQLSAARALIKDCRETTNAKAALLREAIGVGDIEQQAQLHAALTEGSDAIIASAITANRKMKFGKRGSLEHCLSIPTKLDFSKRLPEPVRVWPQPKSNGGYRMIHDHGLLHRTAQHIVTRIMEAHYVPRPFQFTHSGIHAAIKETKALIEQGYVHTAHLDIANFFGSFELEKLQPELPLAPAVVAHAVVGRHTRTVLDPEHTNGKSFAYSLPHTHTLLEEARLGVPQGSACSSIVAAYCVSRLQWPSIAGVALLNFADDFLLLAISADALTKAADELVIAVENLPGGTFKLKLKATRTASQGFKFLGHQLQIKEGALRTWPTVASQEEFFGKLSTIDRRLGKIVYPLGSAFGKFDKQAAVRVLAEYFAIVDGWRAAFKACDDLDRFLVGVSEAQTEWLDKIGTTLEKVKAAITPDMEYHLDPYAFDK